MRRNGRPTASDALIGPTAWFAFRLLCGSANRLCQYLSRQRRRQPTTDRVCAEMDRSIFTSSSARPPDRLASDVGESNRVADCDFVTGLLFLPFHRGSRIAWTRYPKRASESEAQRPVVAFKPEARAASAPVERCVDGTRAVGSVEQLDLSRAHIRRAYW